MKILVAVKRVIDPYVKIRVKPDKSGVETKNVKMAMNPFDEIAIEEALRLKEKNIVKEIVLVSIGDSLCQESLRHGLALGADRAILIQTSETDCALNIAKILQKVVIDEEPSLVLMGKQSIDADNNQTPQMLAGLLGWRQATFASKITINEASELLVTREVDGGLETLRLVLPAIVSTDLRLNEPRYASLPNIMKAKQKPLAIIEIDKLGVTLKQHQQVIEVNQPEPRKGGVQVTSIDELLDKLRHEAKVLE